MHYDILVGVALQLLYVALIADCELSQILLTLHCIIIDIFFLNSEHVTNKNNNFIFQCRHALTSVRYNRDI